MYDSLLYSVVGHISSKVYIDNQVFYYLSIICEMYELRYDLTDLSRICANYTDAVGLQEPFKIGEERDGGMQSLDPFRQPFSVNSLLLMVLTLS